MERNERKRLYQPGVQDEGLWTNIFEYYIEHNCTYREVADKYGCAESTVAKVLKRVVEDGWVKKKKGPKPTKTDDSHLQMIETLIDLHPDWTLRSFKNDLHRLGIQLSLSTLHKAFHKLERTKVVPNKEDPRKWSQANCIYYESYRLWMRSLSDEAKVSIAYFDEVRVDRTALGSVRVWNRAGSRANQERYKQNDAVRESWTITLMITLMHDPPFVFKITEGASNGTEFLDFIVENIDIIEGHSYLIGDNASFHANGRLAKDISDMLAAIGTSYKLLPPYSPEFNPTEMCFSVMKSMLHRSNPVNGILLDEIIEALNHITIDKVHKFYYHSQITKIDE